MSELNQRHQLVLLFTDLTDSTRIAARLEPEHYADLLSQLRQHTQTIIARHGGEVVRVDGDGALCIFGYPLAYEDAGRRAAEAALDLCAATAELATSFGGHDSAITIHSGIHAGVVLLRSGDLVRGRYEMLGDATNVAARLCDAAGPGEILISEQTLGADRHFFQTGPHRTIPLSGRAEPLRALPVLAREDLPHRFATREMRGLSPFVGRSRERAQLDALLDAVNGNATRQVRLVGPPGIGKTRLLNEFLALASAQGVEVLRGYCEAYLGAKPLQPFAQIAAVLDGQHGASDGAIGDRLRQWASQPAAVPAILAIDDWQWADDASHALLGEIVSCRPAGLLVLQACRPEASLDPTTGETVSIEIGPLATGEADLAIGHLLRSADPFRVEKIRDLSGGSPLFIEELCHAQVLLPGAEPDGGTAWLDTLVNARFAALPAEQAELVRTAAVIGHMVPIELFAAVTGRDRDDPLLAELTANDFLYQGDIEGTLRFKHILTRDAVYRTVGLTERKRLHGLIAKKLEALANEHGKDGYVDALAYHNWSAGLDGAALQYAILAGDSALAAGALDHAQRHYRVAFELVERLPDGETKGAHLWSALNKYGLACIVDPAADQLRVIVRAKKLASQMQNRRIEIRAAYWLGAIAYGNGDGKNSVLYLHEAKTGARNLRDGNFLGLVRIKLAQSLFVAGRYKEAALEYDEILPFIRSLDGRNHHETAAYALACYGFFRADQGDFAAALSLYQEAEERLGDDRKPMNASFFGYQAATAMWMGRWQDCIDLSHKAISSSERSRARYQSMINRAKIAIAQWNLTGDPEAQETLELVAQWFVTSGNSQQRATLVLGWLVEVLASSNKRDLARRYAIEVFNRLRKGGDRLGEAMTWRALAKLELGAGRQDLAERYLKHAQRSAAIRQSRHERAHNLLCEAELQRQRGQINAAHETLQTAKTEYLAMNMVSFAAAIANP